MACSDRLRRSSGYSCAASVTRHGTMIRGASRSTSPRRSRRLICSSVNPSPRRSAIQASRIASTRLVLAGREDRITNRHGSLWCGAGAVSAAAIARRTAASLTGSAVNARIVRRASSTSDDPNRNMSSSAGRMSSRAPGPSGSVTRPARPRTRATGTPADLPLTRSAAAAISSATAATVTSRMLPNVSASPR
jgi:hypothetical protein